MVWTLYLLNRCWCNYKEPVDIRKSLLATMKTVFVSVVTQSVFPPQTEGSTGI